MHYNHNYLFYADLTKKLIDDLYNSGNKHNDISYMSHNTCERYMKHLIDRYYSPNNKIEYLRTIDILHSNDLNSIKNFLHENMNLEYSENTSLLIDSINGFYFTTRYPGDNSMVASEADIDRCFKAVNECAKETKNMVQQLNSEINIEEDRGDDLEEIISIINSDEDDINL